jgi:hypothetical protein
MNTGTVDGGAVSESKANAGVVKALQNQRLAILVGLGGTHFPGNRDLPFPGTDILEMSASPALFEQVVVNRDDGIAPTVGLAKFDCIVNSLTNPDVAKGGLRSLTEAVADFPGRLINHPSAVLRTGREAVSALLADIPGLIVPKVVRLRWEERDQINAKVDRSGVTFPAILRVTGTHLGHSMVIVHSLSEVMRLCDDDKSYYLTTFADYRSPDGLYRKRRYSYLGEDILLRHVLASDHWSVHAEARDRVMNSRPHLIAEELDAMTSDIPKSVESILCEVRRRIGLDFFGIDCSILASGEILFFEANASMNYFHPSVLDPAHPHLLRFWQDARDAFERMISPDYVPVWQSARGSLKDERVP